MAEEYLLRALARCQIIAEGHEPDPIEMTGYPMTAAEQAVRRLRANIGLAREEKIADLNQDIYNAHHALSNFEVRTHDGPHELALDERIVAFYRICEQQKTEA